MLTQRAAGGSGGGTRGRTVAEDEAKDAHVEVRRRGALLAASDKRAKYNDPRLCAAGQLHRVVDVLRVLHVRSCTRRHITAAGFR